MLRMIVAALFLCGASPAFAQADALFFQGPWNAHAQRTVGGHAKRPARSAYRGTVIGGRPAGCPRAYCGCASARYVGLSGRQWWLAANWLRLPRAAPGPGMAAARRGHVKIILGSAGRGLWRFYDPNSGRGLTRITIGSLAGYAVVNPRGYRAYARAR